MSVSATVLFNRLLTRARFRHVQVLLRLAELGSLRRAAEAVGMTQPAVTQILADMESLLEVRLFERHARGVRPTAVCRDMLPAARQMLRGLGAGAEAVAMHLGQGEGIVRVVASTAGVNGLLVQALPDFNAAHPGIQVQVQEGDADDFLLSITREEADLVVCRLPAAIPQGWHFQALRNDDFGVVADVAHPLARARKLAWQDLAAETWLPSPANSAARAMFDALSARFDPPLRTCQVITRVPSLTWALLKQQRLVTLVPLSVVRHLVQARELAVLRTTEPMPLAPLGVLRPTGELPAASQRLVDFLLQVSPAAK